MREKVFFIALLCFSLSLSACRSKKGLQAVRSPATILPTIVNVRYSHGSSGVDSCKDCHTNIVEEWKRSFHAQATSSKLFFESSNQYKFAECMQCHAPEKFQSDNLERPIARQWKPEEGVTCSACHVENNRILGPFGSKAPHNTHRFTTIQTSIACAACHRPTYKEWENTNFATQNKHCQNCHMPAIRRKITDYGLIYSDKDSKKHSFEIDFNNIIELDLSVGLLKKDQILVRITNKGAGHNLPTGVYGETAIFVELRIFDRENQVYFREEKLNARDKKSIAPRETRSFFYTFKPKTSHSHLATARVFFSSVNHEDIKLAEISRYFGEMTADTEINAEYIQEILKDSKY